MGTAVAALGTVGAVLAGPHGASASNQAYLFGTPVVAGPAAAFADGTCYQQTNSRPLVVEGPDVWAVYGALDSSGNHVIDIATSTDGGATFSTQQVSTSDSTVNQCDPSVLRHGTTTYVAWAIDGMSSGTVNSVGFASRPDGGAWSVGSATNDGSNAVGSPSMAVNSGGDILIAYAENPGGSAATYLAEPVTGGAASGGTSVQLGAGDVPSVAWGPNGFVVSNTAGTVFTGGSYTGTVATHTAAFNYGNRSVGTSVAVDAGGTIYLAYETVGTYLNPLHLGVSTDGGATFNDVPYYGGGSPDAVSSGFSVTAAAAGTAYLTNDDGNGRFSYTTDGGTTWTPYFDASEITAADASCEQYPSISLASGSDAFVGYFHPYGCYSATSSTFKVVCGAPGGACTTGTGSTSTTSTPTTTTTTTIPPSTTTTVPRTTTTTTTPTTPTTVPLTGPPRPPVQPSLSGTHLAAPIVAVAAMPAGTAYWEGYWLAGADGGIFNYGSAPFLGSLGGIHLASPIVAMAPSPTGHGYWLVGSDGGVFAFGDATYRGSLGGIHLASPIVAMAPSPSGRGYWLVGADGGVFAFGDASFHGSLAGLHLAAPIVGMAATATGQGYWMTGSDGAVFAIGAARYYGSLSGVPLAAPVVGIRPTPVGNGYWLTGADGGVFAIGAARYYGTGAASAATVGMAVTPTGDGYWLAGADGSVTVRGAAQYYG